MLVMDSMTDHIDNEEEEEKETKENKSNEYVLVNTVQGNFESYTRPRRPEGSKG
jgi:hypothetical protein